jgi:hypothetical protein
MIQRIMSKDKVESMLISFRAESSNSWINELQRSKTASMSSKSASLEEFIDNSISQRLNSEQDSRWQKNSQDKFWNNRNSFHKSSFKNLSSASTSKNSYINETKSWVPDNNALCMKCEESDHISKKCADKMLSAWEQSYLKSLMFENSSQSNFCATEYEHYDENVELYENISSDLSHWHSETSSSNTEYTTESKAAKISSVESNSITYDVSKDTLNQDIQHLTDAVSFLFITSLYVNVMYEEESESNKRFHHESIVLSLSVSITASADQIERTIRKKSQKRVNKKFESQSPVKMFDDIIDIYEKSISIWKVLKNHKINMNLLNWMTWSSEACKELKRLCTRITKKRIQKSKKNSVVYSIFSKSFNSEVSVRLTLSSINTIVSEIENFMKNLIFQSNESLATYVSLAQYNQSFQTLSQTLQNWQRKTQSSQQSSQKFQQSMQQSQISFTVQSMI